jgi:hypothetical protein
MTKSYGERRFLLLSTVQGVAYLSIDITTVEASLSNGNPHLSTPGAINIIGFCVVCCGNKNALEKNNNRIIESHSGIW